MSNATKTLTALLSGLIVLIALVEIMSNTGSSEAFRQKLLEYNPSDITRVEIKKPNQQNPVVLRKSDGGWLVQAGPTGEEFPADSNQIAAALTQLNSLNTKAVVTRDTSDFTRFKVDSTGSYVTFFANDEPVGSITVGAPQFISRQEFNTYVRPGDSKTVYSVEGFLAPNINKEVEGWRDKQVWNINRTNITQIDLLYPADSSFSIMKAAPNKWTSIGDTLNQNKVDQLISQVTSLRATGYPDTLSVEQFNNPLYTVRLHLDNGAQKSLRLKLPGTEKPTNYLATASDFPYLFSLSKSTFDGSVLLGRDALLPEQQE